MAWKTATHAEAPQGVLLYAAPEPGHVTWFEPDGDEGGGGGGPPVNVDIPHVTQAGNTLTCTQGNWNGTPTAYAYQWNVGGSNVGTDADTYTVSAADNGATAICTVTATNAAGSTAAPASAPLVIEGAS